MSARFSKLKVSQVKHQTEDAFSIYFEKPSGDNFNYKPGQYLIIKVNIEGKELRRAFSLSTSPVTDDQLAVTIKAIPNGKVSNYLRKNLKAGDELEVMPPMGNFTVDLDEKSEKSYVLIGGGSGITPLMSIIKSVLKAEPSSKINLIYANKNVESIIFYDDLKTLEKESDGRLSLVLSVDSTLSSDWDGIVGMLDENRLKNEIQKLNSELSKHAEFYICGPSGMMNMAQNCLENLSVDKSRIHREFFTAKLPEAKDDETKSTDTSAEDVSENTNGDVSQVTVIIDGKTHELKVESDETILEAGIDAGIDPPFACQEGICTTCKAKLKSGKVKMDEDEGLTDDEIDEGYILTCQSHPTSPGVVVEYE